MAGPEQAPPPSWSMAGVAAWVTPSCLVWAIVCTDTDIDIVWSMPGIALMAVAGVAAPTASWWIKTARAASNATTAAHVQRSALPRGLIRRYVAAVIAFHIRCVGQDRHYTRVGYCVHLAPANG